jgi:electron transport complex protein RnfE
LSSKLSFSKEFIKGLWENNPVFKQALGLCPTLAVTVSAINGIAMALATTFVLVFSSFIVSLIRKLIPTQVRIAAYILIIATFVTIVDLVMKAQFPELSKALGPYIPLIVVNCLILGRQEAFSSKNSVFRSVIDAFGMGTGFLLVLFILGGLREIFGSRTLLGFQIMPDFYEPWLIMILPAGAFLTLGLLMGMSNAYLEHKKKMEKDTAIKEYLRVKAALAGGKEDN